MKRFTSARNAVAVFIVIVAAILFMSAQKSNTDCAGSTQQEKCGDTAPGAADVKLHILSFHLDELL
ncbi:MAG TPA: hypothetical protein PL045_02185 [Chitinophagaceae bacterium]|nr:hypothetical protein [Chitinophagaceae bacterium]